MTEENVKPDAGPYAGDRPTELILRDQLALDRTVLANERTLLAYVRTALTLFLVGISLIHLPDLHPRPKFGDLTYDVAGWLFVAAAVVALVIGLLRYYGFKAALLNIRRRA